MLIIAKKYDIITMLFKEKNIKEVNLCQNMMKVQLKY